MKPIKYQDQTYTVPEDVFDLTLGQYVSLYALHRDAEHLDSLDVAIRQASIVSSIPLEVVQAMGWETFQDLCEQITFPKGFSWPDFDRTKVQSDSDRAKKAEVSFWVEGRKFFFQPDYAYQSVGLAARIEDTLRGKDFHEHLTYLFAIAAHEEGESFSFDDLQAKSELMARAKLSDVYHAFFFFLQHGKNSLLFTAAFSKASPSSRMAIAGALQKAASGAIAMR